MGRKEAAEGWQLCHRYVRQNTQRLPDWTFEKETKSHNILFRNTQKGREQREAKVQHSDPHQKKAQSCTMTKCPHVRVATPSGDRAF